ncbi:MAG: GNAT family N-acetyltransferase [Ignavibacteriales bacterium]|nr:GNAT family N-acetyltransferase [Ignavibacteriales bacterium]
MGQLVHPIDDLLRLEKKNTDLAERNRNSVTSRTTALTDISIKIISDLDELYSLHNEWNELAASSENPLLQFAWYASCAEAFSSRGYLHTIVVKRRDEVVAIAPLGEVGEGGARRLEILGSSILCEPCGFLFKDDAALAVLIDTILRMKKPVFSGRLDNSSTEFETFQSAGKHTFAVQAHHVTHSPWLPITESWKEFQKTISASKRSALRRAQRRANEYGAVTMEILSPRPDDMQCYLDEIYTVEHASWKARTKTSIRSNSQMKKFFNTYAKKMATDGALRLSLMRIDGRTVAGQIGVEYAGRFWVLKVGYDERFAHCSPGILLMHHTIQYAFERGMKSFEFLGRDEQWIRMWSENVHHYSSYWHYPINTAGIVWFVKDSSRILLTKISTLLRKKNYAKND